VVFQIGLRARRFPAEIFLTSWTDAQSDWQTGRFKGTFVLRFQATRDVFFQADSAEMYLIAITILIDFVIRINQTLLEIF